MSFFFLVIYIIYAVVQAAYITANERKFGFEASLSLLLIAAPLYTLLVIIKHARK